MRINEYSKYFFVIYLVILFAIVAFMIQPIFSTLLLAILFSLMFLPAYNKIYKKTKSKNGAAILTLTFMIICIIIFIIIPSIFFIKTLSQEVVWETYISVRLKLNEPFSAVVCEASNYICLASQKLSEVYQTEPTVRRTIDTALENMLNQGTTLVSDFILSTPEILLNLFIIIFVSFFLMRDYESITNKIQDLIPLSNYYSRKLTEKINNTIYSLIYGSIIVAIIQGIVAAVGYYIFGVENIIILGVLTAFVAFVPFIGTFLVWGLVSLKMMILGYFNGDANLFFNGFSLFLYGALIISLVDNILKPRIIAEQSKTHPILILIGIVGGGYFFGIPGLILGPVIMAVFDAVVTFYEEMHRGHRVIT